MSKASLASLALLAACAGESAKVGAVGPTAAAAQRDCPDDEAIPDDRVVATWDGGQVTYGELRGRIDTQLRSMDIQYELSRYDTQAQALDQLVLEALLDAEAKRLGHADVDTLLVKEIEEKVPPPTDQEIADFYPVVARQLGGATLEEARPFLAQELQRRAQQEAFATYLDDLKARANTKAELPYPDLPRIDVPIAEHDPHRGTKDAKVTIVQFAEYQCYYCNKVNPTLERVLETYDGKVDLVFKDFPLSGHSRAIPAAVAAHCAGEQGKYWEMNKILLENQQALGDGDMLRYAGDLALDTEKFQACAGSGKYEPTIQADMEDGRVAGVTGTPAFFVNGIYLNGAQPFERFQAVIDKELAQ